MMRRWWGMTSLSAWWMSRSDATMSLWSPHFLVTGFYNRVPQFKFICRRNVILSIDTDKTNEEDLHNSVTRAKKILEDRNHILLEYTSYPDTSTVPGHYVLFWEIKSTCEGVKPLDPQLLESCCISV
uniref:GH3 C-terminal domain-containing protein n=1 Tax=Aegilops tauschii subsp. strangulata TaxID=200361 RepID=A0A453AQZ3_AEGTS